MASSSNGNGNVMDEFEEAFQACLHALTKQESNTGVSKEETELEVEQTAHKFIDLARQMETFFLQKRFLISVLKPEMLLKDENQELRLEIARKDALINKHYQRLEQWKALLSDQQQSQGYNKPILPQPGPQNEMRVMGNPVNPGLMAQNTNAQMGMNAALQGMTQAQLQQQHLQAQQQQQQQQQQQMLQAQQMQQMQQMQVGHQQMYMQQGGPVSARGNFNQAANVLQGPLAYLEKTTSNIDLVGMGDGRR